MSFSEDCAWSLEKDMLLLRVPNEYMTSDVARTFRLVADTWEWIPTGVLVLSISRHASIPLPAPPVINNASFRYTNSN
jgi:hypothetical protein